MPSLADLTAIIRARVGDQEAIAIEQEIRRTWPGERVYVAPLDSRKDPGRTERIRQAAKRLPVAVVAERHGVSRSWVYQVNRED